MPEEKRTQGYAAIGRWYAENSSKISGGNELQPPRTATTVRFQDDGQPLVTDGPFIEGSEVIGGYAALDEALRLARTWPGRAIVEVRPVVPR
jgi:hypothetical protein